MPNTAQLKQLGQMVRDARKQRKWTLKELATHSRVGYSYLSNIERGYVNPRRGPVTPSDDVLSALSQTLDIPLSTMHASLGRLDEGAEIIREPFLDQIREAGVIEDLPPETQEEILDYMRFKAEQARRQREKE